MREETREKILQELREKLKEGADSGPGIDADVVFSRLEAKYKQQAVQKTSDARRKEKAKPKRI